MEKTVMRFFVVAVPFATIFMSCATLCCAQSKDTPPITPMVELQSSALLPGLELKAFPRPVHQIRFLVDSKVKRGLLILDGNQPQFSEVGELVGGIQTPSVRAKGKEALIQKIECTIDLIKDFPNKWRLYRINVPENDIKLHIATRGSMLDGGPARLIILGADQKPRAVLECTRYGLVVP